MPTLKRIYLSLIILLWAVPAFAGSQQASGVTAQTIVDDAQVYLNDAGNDLCSDTQLLQFLNDGILDLVALSHCLQTTEKVTLQTGVSQYAISTTYVTVKGAIYNAGATTYNKPLQEVDLFDKDRGLGMPEDVEEPVYWDEFGGNLYVWPEPVSGVSGYTVTAYLVEAPSGITLTGAVPTPAVYDKALTYYVAAQAYFRDRQFGFGELFMKRYEAEVARYRVDINFGKAAE